MQLSDLDSNGTGRTEDGALVRERVRGGVAKISAGGAALSPEDCAKLEEMLSIISKELMPEISLGTAETP